MKDYTLSIYYEEYIKTDTTSFSAETDKEATLKAQEIAKKETYEDFKKSFFLECSKLVIVGCCGKIKVGYEPDEEEFELSWTHSIESDMLSNPLKRTIIYLFEKEKLVYSNLENKP
jgi:hypothetical protein